MRMKPSSFHLIYHVIHMIIISQSTSSCDMPDPIPNTISAQSNQSLSIGSYIIWECREGYMMQGDTHTVVWVCLEDGTWLGQSPSCKTIECSSPPITAYSSLDPPLAEAPVVNETITYTCSSDEYTLIGQSSNRCLQDGTWENDPPVCQKNCDTGNTNTRRYSDLTCYRRRSSNNPRDWSGALDRCDSNGELLATVKDAETQVFLLALVSQEIDNDVWIGAMEGRDWMWRNSDKFIERFFWQDAFPNANSKDCIELSYQSGSGNFSWNPSSRNDENGLLCQYNLSCQITGLNGSDMVIDYMSSCYQFLLVSLDWSEGALECERRGGYLAEIFDESTNDLLASRALYLRQNNIVPENTAWWIGGYDNDDSSERSWYWSDKTRMNFEAWHSGRPNSYYEECVEMRKDYQYEWNDRSCPDSLRTLCQIGIPACGDPGQPLHGYHLPDDRTTYSVGATLHFSCIEGFTLSGANILRCLNNGSWDHQRPSCEAVVCKEIPPVMTAASRVTLGIAYQDITIYTCEDDYLPTNEPISFCQHNGTWSTPNFTCTDDPTSPQSSRPLSTIVENNPTTIGSTIERTPNSENPRGTPPIVAIASGSAVALLVLVAVIIAIILIFRRLRMAPPKETDHNLEDRTEYSCASNIHKQDQCGDKDNLAGVSSNTHNLPEHAYEQTILNTSKDRSSMKTNHQDLLHTYEQPSLTIPIMDYNESSMDNDDGLGHTYMQSSINDSTDNTVLEHTYLNKFDDDYLVPIKDTGVGVESKSVYETVD